MEKEYIGEADATGHDPSRPRRNRKIHITNPDVKRDGHRSGRTDELRYLPHFLLLSSWLPWPPSFCCTESEGSGEFELSEFIPAAACV